MARGAHTVAELAKAVALVKTRDARRTREIRALRGDVDRIEALLMRYHVISPATNGTPPNPIAGATAGTAFARARNFFRRIVTG